MLSNFRTVSALGKSQARSCCPYAGCRLHTGRLTSVRLKTNCSQFDAWRGRQGERRVGFKATTCAGTQQEAATRAHQMIDESMPAVQALALALHMTSEEAISMCQQAPGLLRRSPTAIASKICTISESTGIEFGRITSLLVRAGACRMLLFSPMNIVHRLEAIAGVFGLQPDEKLVQDREEVEGDKRPTRADLKRSVRGHALCLAETQPGLLLRTDLDKLRGVGRVVMRELDEMRTEVSSSAGQP